MSDEKTQQENQRQSDQEYFKKLKAAIEENQAAHEFTVVGDIVPSQSQKWMDGGTTQNASFKGDALKGLPPPPTDCQKCRITLQFRDGEKGSFEFDPNTGAMRVNFNEPSSIKAAVLFAKSRGTKELIYDGDLSKLNSQQRKNLAEACSEQGMALKDQVGNKLERGEIVNEKGVALDSPQQDQSSASAPSSPSSR